MARRKDDSNKFVVSVTMFNRANNLAPFALLFLTVLAIALAFWFTREKR
jgi:Mg2+ and Co2+ transporter CorA